MNTIVDKPEYIGTLEGILKLINRSRTEPSFCFGVKCIVVQGYLRSGSTMTFDVLAESGTNFHVFEPILDITEKISNGEPVTFFGGALRNISRDELPNVQAKMLSHWLDCDFTYLNIGDLKHPNLVHHSKVTRRYFSCTRRSSIGFCVKMLESICSPQYVRIVKVVRMRMYALAQLFARNNNMRVIYILRDPRAMVYSMLNNKLLGFENIETYTKTLCQEIEFDLKGIEILKQKFTNNIFVLKYEALVRKPIESFKTIFNFTDLEFSPRVKKFIERHLQQRTNSFPGNPWLIRTGDGNEIANKWRNSVHQNDLDIIDKVCSVVYKNAGYRKLDELYLQDPHVSTVEKPRMEKIFDLY